MIEKRKSYIEPTEKDALHASYTSHRVIGTSYVQGKEEDLILRMIHEEISETDLYFIEEKLQHTWSHIEHGHWKSAMNSFINDVTVEGAFTQVLYDEALTDMNDYITENYS